MHGLQNRLNILYEMANSLGMINILDKYGIALFRNGGHIIRREKIMVRRFQSLTNKYLGICLSTRLSFSNAFTDIAARAMTSTILKLLEEYHQRTHFFCSRKSPEC